MFPSIKTTVHEYCLALGHNDGYDVIRKEEFLSSFKCYGPTILYAAHNWQKHCYEALDCICKWANSNILYPRILLVGQINNRNCTAYQFYQLPILGSPLHILVTMSLCYILLVPLE
jgi:hypothetical protein